MLYGEPQQQACAVIHAVYSYLSVKEILEQVMVKNLDTGEAVPLSIAEEKLPKCTNPLALQIMRLTSEYSRYCKRFLVMIQIPEIHFVVQD